MLNIDKSYEKDGRMYYCLNDMPKLVNDVVEFKDKQLEKYKFNYYEYMLREKKNKENKTGFWQRARSFNE
jgi:alanine dehydrogenase